MIKTFKANNPSNNFLLFVYGLVLKFGLFLHPVVPQSQASAGVLYKYFLQLLHPVGQSSPVIYSLITFLFLFIQALGFNTIVNTQRMLQRPTYLTGMSYLLITSVFADWYVLSAPLDLTFSNSSGRRPRAFARTSRRCARCSRPPSRTA